MRGKQFHLLMSLLLLFWSIGCSVVPVRQAWRPWTRSLGSIDSIPTGSSIQVQVKGDAEHALGDESLFQRDVRSRLEDLLKRRGFSISNHGCDFVMEAEYRTVPHDMPVGILDVRQASFSSSNSYAGAANSMWGLGAAVAQAVLTANQASSMRVRQTSRTETYQRTDLALTLRRSDGSTVWKGEAEWQTTPLETRPELEFALRLLCSSLPRINHPWAVPQVVAGRGYDFRKLNTDGQWFSCPALPYKLQFASTANVQIHRPAQSQSRRQKSLDLGKNTEFALAALVDLAQYAEFAVPRRGSSWRNPLDKLLWNRVTLGGKYVVAGQQVNILMELTGRAEGYTVSKAWVATDEEYAEFERDLQQWQARLNEFYHVLE